MRDLDTQAPRADPHRMEYAPAVVVMLLAFLGAGSLVIAAASGVRMR